MGIWHLQSCRLHHVEVARSEDACISPILPLHQRCRRDAFRASQRTQTVRTPFPDHDIDRTRYLKDAVQVPQPWCLSYLARNVLHLVIHFVIAMAMILKFDHKSQALHHAQWHLTIQILSVNRSLPTLLVANHQLKFHVHPDPAQDFRPDTFANKLQAELIWRADEFVLVVRLLDRELQLFIFCYLVDVVVHLVGSRGWVLS